MQQNISEVLKEEEEIASEQLDASQQYVSQQKARSGLLSKLTTRIGREKDFRQKLQTFRNILWKFFRRSGLNKQFYASMAPGNHPIEGILKKMSIELRLNEGASKFLTLVKNYHKEICRVYGIEIFLEKPEKGSMELWAQVGRHPFREVWNVKGGEMRCNEYDDYWGEEKQEIKLLKELIKLNSLFDEIEIQDSTNEEEKDEWGYEIVKTIANTSRALPTIVKYIHKGGDRRLFISVPEYLDPTTFWKQYGGKLSKIHSDFYRKEFRGTPKKQFRQRQLLLDVLQKYKGKKYPISTLCERASKELKQQQGIDLKSTTIRRWYLEEIKSIKKATNIN